jgi:hypothetical protein
MGKAKRRTKKASTRRSAKKDLAVRTTKTVKGGGVKDHSV